MISRRHSVQVILDIDCYDDLDLTRLDWESFLTLEGDEKVNSVIIQEKDEIFC
jgi:hypothetical protein